MLRRDFLAMLIASRAAPLHAADHDRRTGGPFVPSTETTIAELRHAMETGATTSVRITQHYLDRIDAIDRAGPKLNSVIETNPQARAIATALDAEGKQGQVRGPLHGIPILVKDNIATGDRMSTSAGSLALAHGPAARDAACVERLRAAGAVIIGKTNLSEWANIRSTRSTSGWSARGGLTRNPYALDRNTSGSSSGSGAAASAGLCAAAVGTETNGSIVSPSSINGLVGIKPTVGYVSQSGIVPISTSQDTAGPMARCVADAAALLAALVEPASTGASGQHDGRPARFDPMAALRPDALAGVRLGVARSYMVGFDRVDAVFERALDDLRKAGAELVDSVEVPQRFAPAQLTVLLTELKAALPRYLAEYAPDAAVRTLADVIAFNRREADRELRYFGQELFEQAEAKGGLDGAEYQQAIAECRRLSRDEGLDAAFAKHRVDAVVAPTTSLPWLTDFVNGDHRSSSFSSPAAIAGYPHVTVPSGYVVGLPVGLSFVGPRWSDERLIGYAYAYEQGSRRRRSPTFAPSVDWSGGA